MSILHFQVRVKELQRPSWKTDWNVFSESAVNQSEMLLVEPLLRQLHEWAILCYTEIITTSSFQISCLWFPVSQEGSTKGRVFIPV